MARAYLEADNDYSFQNVTFAEQGRAIVGMASGFTAEQRRGFSDRPLTPAAGFPAFRLAALRLLCAPLFRILETLAEGDFYLLAIAVDPEVRGAGVGSVLMDLMEDRARSGGSTRLSLDVAAKNERARRLYERRGMSVESKWPRPPFLPALFVRMAKPL
ncbi:MAG: GNAT family N-acetyltransferase [Acidobacteriota bacterium]|nr:GNAT family N-acetyltransferase [Acidobacteriota bacterium]